MRLRGCMLIEPSFRYSENPDFFPDRHFVIAVCIFVLYYYYSTIPASKTKAWFISDILPVKNCFWQTPAAA